jgi:UDP-N-acetylmuramoyl-tripeptide--D-alanyl-D-alanine ligase
MFSLSSIVSSVTGAQIFRDACFDSISTDSRTSKPGQLFVALRGEKFDAHSYLHQVAERGIAGVVVESLPDGWELPAIVVPDTLVALGQIANWHRKSLSIPVIGVTGSNGKTTVKEMISSILECAYGAENRLSTKGNLNNEIGVPLTLMRLKDHHKAAVIEMGMNHAGEISRLAEIAQPTVALVNNAQREHQEFMHTVEAVARENGACLSSLPHSGIAVFPGDDAYSNLWHEMSRHSHVLTFGLTEDCAVRGTFKKNDFGSDLTMLLGGHEFCVNLQAAGENNVRNALAAAACAHAIGVSAKDIVVGLQSFRPVEGRLQRLITADGVIVINDTYNANPDSVICAIDVLALDQGERILVLGDMGEVGAEGPKFHKEIADYATAKGINSVFATGDLTRYMIGANVRHYENTEGLSVALDAHLNQFKRCTVLVKGSRFMKMERVVHHLLSRDV